tara:strand:+ start:146 stop:445 length:300 start_codon:yes stop_codon:yes gene_type:complete
MSSNKNELLCKSVAKKQLPYGKCKYVTMSVLQLKCYLIANGYKNVSNDNTRSELYDILKKDKKAIHLFVIFPENLFSSNKEKQLAAEKEYARRIRVVSK